MPEAKAGYCTWSQHTAPPRGWADHPSQPPAAPPRDLARVTLSKDLSSSSPATSKDTCSLLSLPRAATWTPVEVCLPVTNFYWLKSPRAQVGNREASSLWSHLQVVAEPRPQAAVTPWACILRLCSSAAGKAGKPLGPGQGRLMLSTGPSAYCLRAAGAAQGLILAALCKDNDVGPANSQERAWGA